MAEAQTNPGTVKTLTEYFNKLDEKLPLGKTPSNKQSKSNIPNKEKEGSIKKSKKPGTSKLYETTRDKLAARMKLFLTNISLIQIYTDMKHTDTETNRHRQKYL